VPARPFAVFDIDGTIIRWQLYHALGDQLAKRGYISQQAFAKVRQARMDWKRRTGEDSFHEYEIELVGVFDQALAGLKVSDFTAAADTVFAEYKDQVYTYTRDLIRELQAQHYLLFAISVSPSIIVKLLANYYGFDDFAASEYLAEDGRFTGTTELSLDRKPQLLQELVKKHSADSKKSIAVGDSEGDITMLESVAQPIAFNPSKKLFLHARKQAWHIVIERKNVVYELEPANGSYVLKH
jgi:HAD superfamily hydrolase (TIGR01490 family)